MLGCVCVKSKQHLSEILNKHYMKFNFFLRKLYEFYVKHFAINAKFMNMEENPCFVSNIDFV